MKFSLLITLIILLHLPTAVSAADVQLSALETIARLDQARQLAVQMVFSAAPNVTDTLLAILSPANQPPQNIARIRHDAGKFDRKDITLPLPLSELQAGDALTFLLPCDDAACPDGKNITLRLIFQQAGVVPQNVEVTPFVQRTPEELAKLEAEARALEAQQKKSSGSAQPPARR